DEEGDVPALFVGQSGVERGHRRLGDAVRRRAEDALRRQRPSLRVEVRGPGLEPEGRVRVPVDPVAGRARLRIDPRAAADVGSPQGQQNDVEPLHDLVAHRLRALRHFRRRCALRHPLPEGVEPLRQVLAAAVHVCAKLADRVFDESDLFGMFRLRKDFPVLAHGPRVVAADVIEQRDLVFGANAGMVASFAVVSGVHGAAFSTRIVLLAGLAELIGGTIAMGLGAFLAVKSEQEFILSEREREEREVREFPDEERKEVRTIFARKGFRGQALDQMVQHVTADPVFWVDTMMTEELGLSAAPTGAPLRSGLVVATAYALGAAFPVIPYALPFAVPTAFAVSVGCTLAALFAAGAAKTRMTGRSWL